jgi:hypothetical protein
LRTTLTIFTVAVLGVLAGCEGTDGTVDVIKPLKEGKELFTVDFQEGQTLRYRFVSSRDITLDWGTVRGGSRRAEGYVDKSSESMDMVVSYTPVKVDPYGLSTIKATCDSVKVRRSPSKGRRTSKDAVRSLRGKTFTFTVLPTAKIEDRSQLDELIKEIGKKAFRADTRQGRIKEPDMIGDFISTQWFLWDSISSIEKPIEGVSVGQNWKSKLWLPSPMVMRKARDVTYTFDEIRPSGKGRLAVIRSSFSHAKSAPRGWPVPYFGRMQVSGKFGMLVGYKVLDLQGKGEELFNIDAGRIEEYSQRYRMAVEASMRFPIPGAKPRITIQQKITMKLLGN